MRRLRVMVAEDEPANQRRLVRLLTECGCDVLAAFGDGLEAEDWLATAPELDALFLDIHMPGLDGLSLRASTRPGLPVVLVTAFTEHAVDAFALDVTDYLLKPVTPDRLAKAIARVRRALHLRKESSDEPPPKESRYPVVGEDGVILMELASTEYFEVENRAILAVARGGRFRTKWKTLAEVEAFFPEAGLLRINRHCLIRPECVVSIHPSGGGSHISVRMVGGTGLEASRGAAHRLKARLGLGRVSG